MKPILNMKSYDVVRTTSPNAVLGRVVAGVETIVPIRANLQPIGKKLMSMPEARRSEDLRRFFTATELFLVGHVDGSVTYNADQIVIKGVRFEIFQVDEWPDHFECYASRQGTS